MAQKAHLHGTPGLRGDVGIPLCPKEVQSKQDAAASEISWQRGAAPAGALLFFATRTNSQRKSVADSCSIEVIELRHDIVLDHPLESKTQVIGLNVRRIG